MCDACGRESSHDEGKTMNEEKRNMEEQDDIEEKDAEGQVPSAKISRREAIRRGVAAGAVLAGAGLGLGATVSPEGTSTVVGSELLLPLSLDSTIQFEAFARALGDPRVRINLSRGPELPVGAQQLVSMVNDREFIAQATDVVKSFDQWLRGLESEEAFLDTAQNLKDFMETSYPKAVGAMTVYAQGALPQYQVRIDDLKNRLDAVRSGARPCNTSNTYQPDEAPSALDGWFAFDTCVMATYGAVVNLGAYSNVAIAVFVAAVLAVVAVLVVPAA